MTGAGEPPRGTAPPARLWAVTCLFNPHGAPTRIENFRVFRERLRVPLVTVELAFDGRFALGAGDADILVQLGGGDVMWQKERLLNIAIARVPAGCSAVAVFDADIVLADQDWPARALRALDDAPAVHLFTDVYLLARGVVPRTGAPLHHHGVRRSVAAALAQGIDAAAAFGDPHAGGATRLCWGGAWAYRRDLLARHGLYDAHILFGGDTAIAAACVGEAAMAALQARHAMTPAHRRHYRAWAAGWSSAVAGRVAALPGKAFHLWHGDFANRYTLDHHRTLAALDYDPAADLIGDPDRPWRWSGAKPALESYLADYFAARRDDGAAGPPP